MIDLERKQFIKYAKQFDLNNKNIMRKFHHSFRVMEYANEIALSIKADEEKAKLCGLLHDIGRFRQWTEYETYIDLDSIDHGDLGAEILNEFDVPNKELVIFATKNHNKLEVESSSEEFTLYTNIVRDADKIDIMIEQGNQIKEDTKINPAVIDSIFNHQLVKNKDVKNAADSILRLLSFVFDINFKYTFKLILDKKIIENKIHLLKCHTDNSNLEELEKTLLDYVHKKVEEIIC